VHTYIESNDKAFAEEAEWIKLRRKVLYQFSKVNKILIAKNCRKLVFNNFLLKYCQLYRKTARDKNYFYFFLIELFFFRIFSEFFNTLFSHFDKNAVKVLKS